MIFRNVFADQVLKLSPDDCAYVHTVRWIKPYYVSLSVLLAILCGVGCWFLAFSVGLFFVVSALFKFTFVGRWSYYCRRMVGIGVDVESFLVGFSLWIMGSVRLV